MTPLRQWIAVQPNEKIESSFLWIPVPPVTECKIGTVMSIGPGRLMNGQWTRPMPVVPGQRVLYSSRIDQYHVGKNRIDVIEDESIIGVMDDHGN